MFCSVSLTNYCLITIWYVKDILSYVWETELPSLLGKVLPSVRFVAVQLFVFVFPFDVEKWMWI